MMMTIICWIGAVCQIAQAILATGKATAFDTVMFWLSAALFLGSAIWLGPYLDSEDKRLREKGGENEREDEDSQVGQEGGGI
jgi:hypothetical protein